MKRTEGPALRPKIRRRIFTAGLLACCLASAAGSQSRRDPTVGDRPDAEFQIARIMYATNARAGSHGVNNPMWAVDFPLAEEHFVSTLKRYTRIDATVDTRHLALTDDRIFQYPFAWIQQPGYWDPTDLEVQRLREYIDRGGFLMLDDFHGRDWTNFEYQIRRVFPDRELEKIPDDDAVMQIFFQIAPEDHTPVPGDRHLRGYGATAVADMPPAEWRGIRDEKGRLVVIANYNMDLGDSWEHADDPRYPLPFTAFAYKLGVNYVLYALTH
jgi:uncharacterized protein DUF4159